jgi:hypothetical protein
MPLEMPPPGRRWTCTKAYQTPWQRCLDFWHVPVWRVRG